MLISKRLFLIIETSSGGRWVVCHSDRALQPIRFQPLNQHRRVLSSPFMVIGRTAHVIGTEMNWLPHVRLPRTNFLCSL